MFGVIVGEDDTFIGATINAIVGRRLQASPWGKDASKKDWGPDAKGKGAGAPDAKAKAKGEPGAEGKGDGADADKATAKRKRAGAGGFGRLRSGAWGGGCRGRRRATLSPGRRDGLGRPANEG